MGSFPETYNGPNRLRSKRRLYSTKASKAFPIELLCESWRERAEKGMRGRWRGKEEILPRKPHDAMKRAMIFLCFLFSFVPLKFHAILVTRSDTLVTQATGFHVFPLEISCKDFSLSSPTCFLRLQNSPYFCVFKYARAVKQKVSGSRASRA